MPPDKCAYKQEYPPPSYDSSSFGSKVVVDDSFDPSVWRFYSEIEPSIREIDKMYPNFGGGSDPLIFRIEKDLSLNGMRASGMFRIDPTGTRPHRIALDLAAASRSQAKANFMFLHELGHWYDWERVGIGLRFASEHGALSSNPAVRRWRKLMGASPEAEFLYQAQRNPEAAMALWGITNRDHVVSIAKYLSQPNEMWARSFNQYIALKSGHPEWVNGQTPLVPGTTDGRPYSDETWRKLGGATGKVIGSGLPGSG